MHASPTVAYFNVIHVLYGALPKPILATPEALRQRIQSSIAMVASLVPVNPAEALLAAHWVAATMQAMDCQTMAHDPSSSWERKVKCLAQVSAMQRNAKGLLEQFRQMQMPRIKREGLEANADQAAWIEHRVGSTLETALEGLEETLLAVGLDQNMGQNPIGGSHETDSGKPERARAVWTHLAYPASDHGVRRDPVQDGYETDSDKTGPACSMPTHLTDPGSDQNMRRSPVSHVYETDSDKPHPACPVPTQLTDPGSDQNVRQSRASRVYETDSDKPDPTCSMPTHLTDPELYQNMRPNPVLHAHETDLSADTHLAPPASPARASDPVRHTTPPRADAEHRDSPRSARIFNQTDPDAQCPTLANHRPDHRLGPAQNAPCSSNAPKRAVA